MKLGIIIIDDEQDAIEAIESIICLNEAEYKVLAKTTNPHEAIGLILQHKPDVVFLDIEMPGLNGFQLLENIPEINFEVIFATAYEQYAIQAIKNNAADYILKPVSIQEINEALEKVKQRVISSNNNKVDYKKLIRELNNGDYGKLKVSSSAGFDLIDIMDIISIEAQGMYSEIKLKQGDKLFVTKPLKELEEQVDENIIFRTHRSYLINMKQVKRFESESNTIIMCDNSRVKLSRRRKEDFLKILEDFID